MVVPADSQVALLSIKPRFAGAILSGEKKVEFRRQPFAREIHFILIYASSPVQRLVGYFDVAGIDRDTPSHLWSRYGAVSGLSKTEFAAYTEGVDEPVAIRVGRIVTFATPLALQVVATDLRAPQSFCYVDAVRLTEISRTFAASAA